MLSCSVEDTDTILTFANINWDKTFQISSLNFYSLILLQSPHKHLKFTHNFMQEDK